jgi:hypothetical protein
VENGEMQIDSETKLLEETIVELEALRDRGSATENERRAARLVESHLAGRHLEVNLESFRGHNSYGGRILVHLVAGLLALSLLFWAPLISCLLSLTVFVSFILETTSFSAGLSRLLPGNAPSQNVVGRVPAAKQLRRRIVVTAHLDTQRTGWIWNSRRLKTFTSVLRFAPGPLRAPLILLTVILLAQTILAALASQNLFDVGPGFVVEPNWFFLLLALFYVAGIIVTGQWSVGKFVPGANDNATGVASALALANRWTRTEHDETELVVLFTGCEETGSMGAASWIGRHGQEVAQVPTVFLNLDTLGCSHLRVVKDECALNGLMLEYPDALLDLCQSVATKMGLEFTEPISIPTQTDGLAFLVRGIPGITVTSTEEGIFIPNYHLMSDRIGNIDLSSVCRATGFAWRILIELEHYGAVNKIELGADANPDSSYPAFPMLESL